MALPASYPRLHLPPRSLKHGNCLSHSVARLRPTGNTSGGMRAVIPISLARPLRFATSRVSEHGQQGGNLTSEAPSLTLPGPDWARGTARQRQGWRGEAGQSSYSRSQNARDTGTSQRQQRPPTTPGQGQGGQTCPEVVARSSVQEGLAVAGAGRPLPPDRMCPSAESFQPVSKFGW